LTPARQQVSHRHSGRPAAGDAAAHGNFFAGHGLGNGSAEKVFFGKLEKNISHTVDL